MSPSSSMNPIKENSAISISPKEWICSTSFMHVSSHIASFPSIRQLYSYWSRLTTTKTHESILFHCLSRFIYIRYYRISAMCGLPWPGGPPDQNPPQTPLSSSLFRQLISIDYHPHTIPCVSFFRGICCTLVVAFPLKKCTCRSLRLLVLLPRDHIID